MYYLSDIRVLKKFSNKYLTMRIINDFLPADKFDKLSNFVLSNNFPWFYSEQVSLPPEEHNINDPYALETDGWYHMLYSDDEDYKNGGMFFDAFLDFFEELSQTFGYTQDDLLRARLGLKVPKLGYNKENYNLPHIDVRSPHDTIIYYFNDSDGDTRIFNENYSNCNNIEPTKFTVQQTVSPKANRLLLLDGLQYHTASNPLEVNRRVVLNVNLRCK